MRWTRYAAVLSLLVLVAGCGEEDRTAEAEKIKQDLTAGLDVMFGKDKTKFVGYEKLDVVPEGDRFKATLTGLKILPNEPESPNLGDVTFNVLPKDEDKYEITDLLLPSPISIAPPDGQAPVKFEIGSQRFSGLWSKTLATFLDADAAYKNVQVTGEPGTKFVIVDLALKNASTDKGGGAYDQTSSFSLQNMTVEMPEGTFSIASVTSSSDSKGVKLAEVRKFSDHLNAVFAASMENKPADPAAIEALKQIQAFFRDSTGKGEIAGISFKDTAGTELFKMEKVAIDAGWFGFDQPKGKFDMSMRFDGISAPAAATMPEAAMFSQYIPSKFGLGITLEEMPSKELWSAFLTVLTASHADPAAVEQAMQEAGGQLMQAITQSGSTVKLNGWEYDSPSVKLDMDGSVKADANAVMGAIASLDLELVGLDTIIGMAQMFSGGDPSTTAPLEMLKQFSDRSNGSDGQPIDKFAVDLAAGGEVTINGKPFDPMAMPPPQ
jgi:hypothetical protein